ncbi:uncharacterized protein LOC127874241 isoform X3 [Dreissena polymorpha]|uniref:uncharacterized protein LOC127874241 isoform X3 n=1 Tax=Dreissena polymorpha TaxID=45954 RepID=UPI002264A0A8|nr:uncharacterized protein LOC127874241 isoform X3 [Dreissena polymorpha]
MPTVHTYDEASISFTKCDGHVQQIQNRAVTNENGLIRYFEEAIARGDPNRDLYMARSILVWMSLMSDRRRRRDLPHNMCSLVDENSFLPGTFMELCSTSVITPDLSRYWECFEFRIVCLEVDEHCRNIPTEVAKTGLGFTHEALNFGLKHPSQTTSTLEVECADQVPGKTIDLNSIHFRIAEDRINEVQFASDYIGDDENIGVSEVRVDHDKGEVVLKAGLKKKGEGVLVLKGKDKNGGGDFKPVANYIVSSYRNNEADHERLVKKNKKKVLQASKRDAKEFRETQLRDSVHSLQREVKQLMSVLNKMSSIHPTK